MKQLLIICIYFTLTISFSSAQLEAVKPAENKEIFIKKAQSDIMRVVSYRLNNGLTVYLNEDHSLPKVSGAVVVKGGASRDPEDASGIAHYFEHIMFKGTSKIGTSNWEAEKVLLDSIRIMYDLLGNSGDNVNFKSQIQKKINDLSVRASEYAIPNEFNKIIAEMGGSGLNAYTSYENIVYYNNFPPESMEKWLKVYANRFSDPVFRLFQSELETVYEEKNMSMDNSLSILFEEIYKNIYPLAPYGKHTILGNVEHLKNPSLTKMMSYFKQYYGAGNMALILVGDFRIEDVKPLIDRYFGELREGDAPIDLNAKDAEFKGRVLKEVKLTPVPVGVISFKTISSVHKDKVKIDVLTKILCNNNGTGLLDELITKGKVVTVATYEDLHMDMGSQIILFTPKYPFQSLNSAEKLILKQLEKLKSGDFDDSLLLAVKNEMIKENYQYFEQAENRQKLIINAFTQNKPWEDVLNYNTDINEITKNDIIEIAKQYFTPNYFILQSKIGKSIKNKLTKPDYLPVAVSNKETTSAYAQSIKEMHSNPVQPKFIQFLNDLNFQNLEGNDLYIVTNPVNQIFSAEIKFEVGYEQIPQLKYIAKYLTEVGTTSIPGDQFKRILQSKAVHINANAERDNFVIQFDGYDRDFDWTIQMISELLSNPEKNNQILKNIAKEEKNIRKKEERDLSIKSAMLYSYAFYGENSYYLTRYSISQIKKIDYSDIVECLQKIKMYKTQFHIVSTISENNIRKVLIKYPMYSRQPQKGFYPMNTEAKPLDKNRILILDDKDALQSHVKFLIPGNAINLQERFEVKPFNQYFGTGMGSLVFQEIREFRSFAYSAYGYYSTFSNFDSKNYFSGGLITQADKTNNALMTYISLLSDMPAKPERTETIKNQMLLSINSNYSSFRNLSKTVAYYKSQGFDEDPNRLYYESYMQLKFEDIENFYKKNLLGKPYYLTIVGDLSKIDSEELKKLGSFQIFELKNIRKK